METIASWKTFYTNPCLVRALLAGCIASVASGIVGTYVVVKRIGFISGSISHAILGGMGFCCWLAHTLHVQQLLPIYGALLAALLAALGIGHLTWKQQQREDTVISTLWVLGMAIGILFLSQTPGYSGDLLELLFGNILWVSDHDLWLLLGLDLFIIAIVALYHQRLVALCFDAVQATLQGVAVYPLYLLLLCTVAVTVVILAQVVGSILVIALLALPAATASCFSDRLAAIMVLSIASGALSCSSGLLLAFHCNWPPGAAIAVVAATLYLLALASKALTD